MKRCTCCDNEFFEEDFIKVRGGFHHAFGFEEEVEYLCPFCGADSGYCEDAYDNDEEEE